MKRSVFTVIALSLLAALGPAHAQWTQWGGPSGDFRVDSAGIPTAWAESGPRMLWKRALGEGESSVLVAGKTLYTMYRDGGEEVVVALKQDSGETVWEHRYAAPLPKGLYVKHGDGPHATPLIVGKRIFTLGISGKLHGLGLESGAVLWVHDLMSEYGGKSADCGYGGSPLAYGDNVIVPVGGPEGHGVMSFKQSTGEVVWKSQDFRAGYASPILIDVGGDEQLVVFMYKEVAGLDPDTGELEWRHPHETAYGVNASTPLWGDEGILFISSAYDNGSRGLKLTRNGNKTNVEEVWQQKKMEIHFGNVVRIGDHLYGTSGDFGPVFLTAVDVRSGELAWKKRDVIGKAQLLDLGGKLLMLDEKGKLALATVTPEGVEVHAEHKIAEGRVWAAPTLVGRTLYVRDRKNLMAFDLGAAAGG